MDFHSWVLSKWTTTLNWFKVEAQKLANLAYPFFKDTEALIKKDGLTDVAALIPIIAQFFTGGITGEAIDAAEAAAKVALIPILKAQGVDLLKTSQNILANIVVAQAQDSIGVTSKDATEVPINPTTQPAANAITNAAVGINVPSASVNGTAVNGIGIISALSSVAANNP